MSTAKQRAEQYNHLGYEVRYFAHRHKISRALADAIIANVGQDRAKQDAAANAAKNSGVFLKVTSASEGPQGRANLGAAQCIRPEGVFDKDVAVIQDMKLVPTMLDTLDRLTGTGFAVITRVTEESWVTCGVRDEIGIGLKPGSELLAETTMCQEIRRTAGPIAIDNIDLDPIYARHQAPAIYGIKSFVGVPIVLPNGNFFGTLCAVGKRAIRVNRPEILNTFTMFAELLATHLDRRQVTTF